MSELKRRIQRLEGPSKRADRAAHQLTDEELEAIIREDLGLPASTPIADEKLEICSPLGAGAQTGPFFILSSASA